ncbi:MAG: hypothetical protein HY220_01290 [Candidatus Sungbacteria bacterium]|uniref:Uncharacterized protein n=1 Tax=Candidatus Sungiibacteriota bacterium TaxID=2750080 RepID=A0A9D6QYF1_9BACT|nr:hypothetical protein [Candidatus Sungbacteria bacterium]
MENLVVSPDQMPDWLRKRAGIMHEIDLQLARGALTLAELQVAAVEHRDAFGLVNKAKQLSGVVEPNLKFDLRKDGFKLFCHSPRIITSVAELELVPFLREDEKSILGYDMLGRAEYDPSLNAWHYGQEDAEFVFDHQGEIPVEFRQFHLVFPRTMWRGPE